MTADYSSASAAPGAPASEVMAAKLILVLSFSCSLLVSILGANTTCPFGTSACECHGNTNLANFSSIACQSKELPNLTGPPGVKYTVQRMTIKSENVHRLPADYFKSFNWIDSLALINNGSSIVQQEFNATVFSNLKIGTIQFAGIDGLLPPPDPLKVLTSTLEDLSIDSHGPAKLVKAGFKDFSLTTLRISRTNLTDIDAYALSGIESQLERLSLSGAGLTTFPTSMLSYLVKLTSLVLSDNRFSSIPKYSLKAIPNLKYLWLSGNPIAADIAKGNLNELPSSLTDLHLDNVGLTSVPTNLLQRNPQITSLILLDNQITKVLTTDFLASPNLDDLWLGGNPISEIERGAFQLLNKSHYIDLSNTSMTYADFSLFAGMATDAMDDYLILDNNAMMKSFDLTSTVRILPTFTISAINTGLETISYRCKPLFDRSTDARMDLSNNIHLQCANLAWLAPYALCNKQVITDNNTLCADQKNQPLKEYLASVMQNPCPTTTTRSTSTTPAQTTPRHATNATGNPDMTTTSTGSVQIGGSLLVLLVVAMLILLLNN